jgi:hypothetical protein
LAENRTEKQRETAGSCEVMKQHRGREHGCVADPVHGENVQSVAHRSGPFVEEGDEQSGAETDEFPTCKEHFDATGQCDQRHPCG